MAPHSKQLRVPAGRSTGGQWTSGGGGSFSSMSQSEQSSLLTGRLGGSVVSSHQLRDDPNKDHILSSGQRRSGRDLHPRNNTFLGQDGNCHWNTGRLYAEGKIDAVVVGYARNSQGWHQHTWGVKDGRVVETTLSNTRNLEYYGSQLSSTQSSQFSRFVARPENRPGNGNVRTNQGGSPYDYE